MLDYRIFTFLKLCDVMNYRVTAKQLNMTQPAVTQHIQFLEQEYGCKLFSYNGKKLSKTEAGKILENYARSADYNENSIRKKLSVPNKVKISVGATKTIGDYVINKQVLRLLQRGDIELSLIVDNTEHLLNQLNHKELDIALIEGFFDKRSYDYKLFKKELFVGICAKEHPFAGKAVPLQELFKENIIIREQGSGTRAIFEQLLLEQNYSLDCFTRLTCISSFELIKELVLNYCGISFVYDAIAKSNKNLGVFTIKHIEVTREFNFVYLKNTGADKFTDFFEII
ncbi:LysR family transcriptional regulator [Anaerophilus nitritogenes]|uniref:LysR family transcriptional regulator n=1 Tax=Anaerophilus nitritogenes TaxID=2498136 RepID=UPI00101CDF2E|nr:LysR family transcriptional regulator [Anaerophilus nitritogenes]